MYGLDDYSYICMGNVNSLLINTYLNEVKMSNVGNKVPMRLGMWFSLLGILSCQTVCYRIKNHLILIINLLFSLLFIIYKKFGPPSMAAFYTYICTYEAMCIPDALRRYLLGSTCR